MSAPLHSEWRRHYSARSLTFAQLHALSHDSLKALLEHEDLPKTQTMLRKAAIRLCFLRTVIAVAHSHRMQKQLAVAMETQAPALTQAGKELHFVLHSAVLIAHSFAGPKQPAPAPAPGLKRSQTGPSQTEAQAQIMRLVQQLVPLLQVHSPGLLQPSGAHGMQLAGGNLPAPEA